MPSRVIWRTHCEASANALTAVLRRLGGCDVSCEALPAENRDVLVVMTDMPDEATEVALQEALA